MTKKTIYFLCTGNSCRSQMVEGWAKKYLGDEWQVYSAGIEAHGLNQKAVKAMEETGVDISNQTSDIINLYILNQADLVITLCGDADNTCPMRQTKYKHEHCGCEDPDIKEWSEYDRVQDENDQKVIQFAKTDE